MSDGVGFNKRRGCGCGCGSFGIGSVLAIVISYTAWHSIPWALLHGFLGWIYVIYYFFVYVL